MAVEPRVPDAGPPAALSHPCPWASRSGNAPGSALPRGGECVAGLMWGSCAGEGSGFCDVAGVFLGLAGRHVRGQQEEKLQIIYEGE